MQSQDRALHIGLSALRGKNQIDGQGLLSHKSFPPQTVLVPTVMILTGLTSRTSDRAAATITQFLPRDATQSAVLSRQVVCPSFCMSVTLRYNDHRFKFLENNFKAAFPLAADSIATSRIYSKWKLWNTPNFSRKEEWGSENCRFKSPYL